MTILPLVGRFLPARLVQGLILRANLWRRSMTLGVRIVVEDDRGRILLVKHTYSPGWHFPGGGVEFGESAEAAAVRELREEAGLVATGRPLLFGLYRQTAATGRDHVALFRLASTPTPENPQDAAHDPEIAERRFAARDALPPETTRATRARLAELFEGAPLSETW